jgi:hypothetical protein
MIRETASKHAPWYVLPAENKWFTRVVVAAAVIEMLADLNLTFQNLVRTNSNSLQLRNGSY